MITGRKKGFTLVELLVVIIILAILAGMLLLSTGTATTMAEATKIVSDIRMLHSALLAYYIDNSDLPAVGANGSTTPLSQAEVKSISVYIDRELDQTRYGAIYLTKGPSLTDSRVLLGIQYLQNVNGVSANLAGVNKRLAKMALGVGLCNADGSIFTPSPNTDVVYIQLM